MTLLHFRMEYEHRINEKNENAKKACHEKRSVNSEITDDITVSELSKVHLLALLRVNLIRLIFFGKTFGDDRLYKFH